MTRVNFKHAGARVVQWLCTVALLLTAMKFFHMEIIATEMSIGAEDPEILTTKARDYTKLTILFILLTVLAFLGLGHIARRFRRQNARS